MKLLLSILLVLVGSTVSAQSLQLHYDLRHTADPARNSKNFPTLYFEYFKNQDSGKSFIKPGSFLFKMQADFTGERNNMGKFYMQVSQTFRCWRPKIFLNLQYSGGAGITEPKQYSFYILNTFSAGLSYPFKWRTAWMSAVLNYKYVSYANPSHDVLYTLYWWKGLFNYKAEFSGDFSIWTENKNHGDEFTRQLNGKRWMFFAEPQCWVKIKNQLSAGTRFNINYHVLTTDNVLQVYPSVAIRCKL